MLIGDVLSYPELRQAHDLAARHRRERLETAEAIARVTASEAGADAGDRGPRRPPGGARRRRLRDQHDPGRRPRGDPARLRDPDALRAAPDDRRHARHRRHLPRAADDPGDAGHRADMAELCPDAWLLNYTNPMAMLCWAYLQRLAAARRSSGSATRSRTRRASWPRSSASRSTRSRSSAPGVNHQAFILRFERDGESLYPALDEAIERDPELLRRVRVQIYRASATSRPSRASTPPSTCPGSCATTTRSSGCGSSSRRLPATRARRTWPSTSSTASASRAASRCRSSPRSSTRRRSSTRSSPASRGSSTATSRTAG